MGVFQEIVQFQSGVLVMGSSSCVKPCSSDDACAVILHLSNLRLRVFPGESIYPDLFPGDGGGFA